MEGRGGTKEYEMVVVGADCLKVVEFQDGRGQEGSCLTGGEDVYRVETGDVDGDSV